MKHFIRLIAFFLVLACIPFASADRLDDSTLLSFYDDSVFIGDSRMESFKRYVDGIKQTDKTFFGKTKIVAAGSISLYIASINDTRADYMFNYAGRRLTLYGVAMRLKPSKIFILLGLNDPIAAKPDKGVTYAETIITRMREQFVPDAEVYFLSETPVTVNFAKEKERPEYQDQLDVYNSMLKETCEKNGAHYIEIAEALKGEDNLLRLDYSNDKVCHLNDDGNAIVVQCLKDYAQQQYDLGLWDPFAEEPAAEAGSAE